ncbi:MAG: ATP-binding protein [Candidatus Latescibacterota bacterium]|nr:MAG: ATP-binding protein [Candidatus Latescibacterota bacterium]
MEKEFSRNLDALSDIVEFTDRFLADRNVDESAGWSINLAIEELFTNMVRHNTGAGKPIRIGLNLEDSRLVVQLVDDDVDPFDPSSVPEVNVDEGIDDRAVGGLGLHLVKSIVDKITYEYENRQMKVTIVKNLEQ